LTPIAGKSRSQCLESTLPASYTRQISLLIGPRSRSCWPSTSDLAHHSGGAIKSLGGYYGRGNRDCGGQSDGRKKSRQRMDQDGWQYTPLKTGGKSMIVEKFVHRNNPFLTRQAGQLSHIRLCHSIKGQASLDLQCRLTLDLNFSLKVFSLRGHKPVQLTHQIVFLTLSKACKEF